MGGLQSFTELLVWAWLTTIPVTWHERCQIEWCRGKETLFISPYFATRAEAEVHRRLTTVPGAEQSEVICVGYHEYP